MSSRKTRRSLRLVKKRIELQEAEEHEMERDSKARQNQSDISGTAKASKEEKSIPPRRLKRPSPCLEVPAHDGVSTVPLDTNSDPDRLVHRTQKSTEQPVSGNRGSPGVLPMLNVVSEQQPPLPAADGSSLEEQSRSGADCWPSYIGPDDLRPLTGPGQWLGDAVVNTVMRIIVAQRPHLRTLDSTYLTTGHSNLRGRTGSSSSDVTVAKAEGLHDSGIGILLPLNLSNQHWVLGCLEVDKKRADVWDPLPSEEHTLAATDLISQFVSRYLPESISSWCEWDHYSFRSIRQHNAYDCGVYILATASFYAADLEMPGSIQVEDWRRLFLTLLPREQPSVSVPPTQCLSPTPSSTTTLECQSSTSIPATPPAESHRVSSSASMQPRLVTAIDATIDVPFTVPTQPPLVIGSTGREDPRMHIQWCSQMLSLGLEAAKDNVRRTRAAVKGRIETIEPIRQVVKILTERGRVELVRLEREMAGSSSASKPLRQYLRRRHMAATAWQRRIGDVGIDAALVYLDARLMELDADDEEIDRFVFFP